MGALLAAVAITDNPRRLVAPFNANQRYCRLVFSGNDIDAVPKKLCRQNGNVAAVIIEGIQGIGGIHIPSCSIS